MNEATLFKQTENEDGTWNNYWVDDDTYVINTVTDSEGNVISEEQTGDCGCGSCLS